MAKTIKDLTAVLAQNFPDEVMAVPGENSIDTAIRILSATQAADALDVASISNDLQNETFPPLAPGEAAFPPSATDKLLVDKNLFYQMFASLVKGHSGRYINLAGMSLIAKVLGAKTRDEEKAEWKKCSDFLSTKGQ